MLGPWNMSKTTSGISSDRRWDDLRPPACIICPHSRSSYDIRIFTFNSSFIRSHCQWGRIFSYGSVRQEVLYAKRNVCIRQHARRPSNSGKCASLFWCCHYISISLIFPTFLPHFMILVYLASAIPIFIKLYNLQFIMASYHRII